MRLLYDHTPVFTRSPYYNATAAIAMNICFTDVAAETADDAKGCHDNYI